VLLADSPHLRRYVQAMLGGRAAAKYKGLALHLMYTFLIVEIKCKARPRVSVKSISGQLFLI
jgi:hypothetical protein